MISVLIKLQKLLNSSNKLDFIVLLAIRLYLAPVFISAGLHKLNAFDSTVEWFGNSDWGLGLPAPTLMAVLSITAEFAGGIALILGLATRWFSSALIVTMLVAIFSVHLSHGWFAIAPSNPQSNPASVLTYAQIPGAEDSVQNSVEVGKRLDRAREILKEHSNYDWITETGQIVILNNGIEFAATYLILLVVLLFYGAGRIFSIDYWLARVFMKS